MSDSTNTSTYTVSVLRADGWSPVSDKTKRVSAQGVYDRHASGEAEPRDYVAVKLTSPAGKILAETKVDNTDVELSDAQCEGLAAMNGDGDLLAELAKFAEEQIQLAAVARPARKQRAPRPEGGGVEALRGKRGSNDGKPGSRYHRATHYIPAPGADPIPFNDHGTEIRICSGTAYVIAQKMNDGTWSVIDWEFLKKADAPKIFAKVRTDDVVEQVCIRRGDGREMVRWVRENETVAV